MDYPAAPWDLVGQLWLSLFRVPEPVDALRPAGVYGAAFVRYAEPSPLTYGELLVARVVRSGEHGRRASICNIWVDSPPSRAGGRELWAIPKDLCDFTMDSGHRGPLSRTEWNATAERRLIASATFHDVSRLAPRVPFRGGTWQPGIPETGGEERTARLTGSAKMLPCRGVWDFPLEGPLGWLAGRRTLASFRMADFRMSFG